MLKQKSVLHECFERIKIRLGNGGMWRREVIITKGKKCRSNFFAKLACFVQHTYISSVFKGTVQQDGRGHESDINRYVSL